MLGLNEWDNCVLGRIALCVNGLVLEVRSVKSIIKYTATRVNMSLAGLLFFKFPIWARNLFYRIRIFFFCNQNCFD